jgi:hypothetical protein
LSRRTAKSGHSARRNLAAGSTSTADTAVAAALDSLLDPLEELRQEELRSETVEAAQSEAAAASSRAPPPRSSGRLRGLADVGKRLRYSNRPRYEQIRETAFRCFVLITVVAVLWLVVETFRPI